MGLAHSPRIVDDNLLFAVDAGNNKSIVTLHAQGQSEFTTPGTHSWTAPADVTSVCVVCVGGGGGGAGGYGLGGAGGGLAYKNNISVTPGQSYTVVVGSGGTGATDDGDSSIWTMALGSDGGDSYFIDTSTVRATGGSAATSSNDIPQGGTNTAGDGGGTGGVTDVSGLGYHWPGGGAGGYSGDGGRTGSSGSSYAGHSGTDYYGHDGAGGGGGGGGYTNSHGGGGGGGGVGIYGEGTSGSGGQGGTSSTDLTAAGGGSGGTDGATNTSSYQAGNDGGNYGGGGGCAYYTGGDGGGGAVRIIWGPGRSFPSTNTGNVTSQSASTEWKDICGKGNNPTLNGGVSLSSDNESFNFDVSSSPGNKYIQFSTALLNQYTDVTDPFTFEMWVKFDSFPSSTNYKSFFSFSYDTANLFPAISIGVRKYYDSSGSDDGTYRLTIDKHAGVAFYNNSNPEMTPNRWYHVLFTGSETPPPGRAKHSVYFNGTYVSGFASDFSAALDDCNILLGAADYSPSGITDELADIGGQISLSRFYSRRLTEEEIVNNYNAHKSRHSVVHKFLEYVTTSVSSFTLRSYGTVNYEVDWGDGTVQTLTTNTPTHTYSNTGKYTIRITPAAGSTYRPLFANFDSDESIAYAFGTGGSQFGDNLTDAWAGANNMESFSADIDTSNVTTFNSAWQFCEKLTTFPLLDVSSGTNFTSAWQNCSGLKSFSALQFNTNASVNLSNAWRNCTGLTSFPVIGSSNVDNFYAAWMFCTALTSFPVIDTSSGTNFAQSWYNCSSLTSFPLLDTSSGTNFNNTWYNCSSLATLAQIDTSSGTNFVSAWYNNAFTSFPALDFSSLTTAANAWENCSSLTTFPANMFDNTGTLTSNAFGAAFNGCALSAQSIENILVSLDNNGAQNNTLTLSGGTNASDSSWSVTAITAYQSLAAKGWTIPHN